MLFTALGREVAGGEGRAVQESDVVPVPAGEIAQHAGSVNGNVFLDSPEAAWAAMFRPVSTSSSTE